MKDIIASLDEVAGSLEGRGLEKLAQKIDLVSNTLEKMAKKEKRPTEAFVFGPGHSKVKDKKGHFPIPDAAHARNALARANQYTKVPSWYDGSLKSLKEAVARAVKFKFKSIEVTEKSTD